MRYGIIGNCKTAALVHETGSVDWCCFPNFDSPSLFGKILDGEAGFFSVGMAYSSKVSQSYLPSTNILETRFDDGENAFVVIDFMPRYREGNDFKRPAEIHRILRPLKGRPSVRVSFQPRLNYARDKTSVKLRPTVVTASNRLEGVFLYSSLPLGDVVESKPIPLNQDHFLLLAYHEKIDPPSFGYSWQAFEKTKEYWETWASHCRLPSVYREEVLRSALVLKLMTFEDTGGDHRRAVGFAPRKYRQGEELGLPLLLAPGCLPHAGGLEEHRAFRRGSGFHSLPPQALRMQTDQGSARLRHRRKTRPRGGNPVPFERV